MNKIEVIFKGEANNNDTNWYEYTSPDCLKKGETYVIKSVGYLQGYSVCTLRGIEGTFNPLWFEKKDENSTPVDTQDFATPKRQTFVAVSTEMPEVGKRIILKRGYDGVSFALAKTSTIQEVKEFAENVYICETKNNTYIVQVFLKS